MLNRKYKCGGPDSEMLLFLILTDMYGDIPYFEAEQGYITGNVTPKFDEQELIYKDMHKELLEAEEQLDENADKLTGDIIIVVI